MTGVDPDIAAVLGFRAAGAQVPADAVPVELARRGHELESAELSGPGEPVAEVADITVDGPGGPIPVRVYRPDGVGPGVVVYLHGGGWVIGSIASFDTACRALALRSGQTVCSVGYRLAPEHPFPAGLEDALAVTRWAVGEAGDPRRVAVAGDSAGGNLATVVARRLHAEGVGLGLQLLVYPVCDAACSTPSYREFAEGFGLTPAGMRRWWGLYLDGASGLDPDCSPVRAPDLSGLPPAWILVAGHDVLRDEALAYAQRLADAGVPVTVRRFEGCTHGFWRWLARCEASGRAIEEAGAALRGALAG